jgi:hypothetical protein
MSWLIWGWVLMSCPWGLLSETGSWALCQPSIRDRIDCWLTSAPVSERPLMDELQEMHIGESPRNESWGDSPRSISFWARRQPQDPETKCNRELSFCYWALKVTQVSRILGVSGAHPFPRLCWWVSQKEKFYDWLTWHQHLGNERAPVTAVGEERRVNLR